MAGMAWQLDAWLGQHMADGMARPDIQTVATVQSMLDLEYLSMLWRLHSRCHVHKFHCMVFSNHTGM